MKIGCGTGCDQFFPGPDLGSTSISDRILNICVAPGVDPSLSNSGGYGWVCRGLCEREKTAMPLCL